MEKDQEYLAVPKKINKITGALLWWRWTAQIDEIDIGFFNVSL